MVNNEKKSLIFGLLVITNFIILFWKKKLEWLQLKGPYNSGGPFINVKFLIMDFNF